MTAQNTRKPFGGRDSAPDPAEGAYSAPANPLVGGEGLAVPSPRTPSPALGPLGLASPTPNSKISSDAVGWARVKFSGRGIMANGIVMHL